MLISGCEASATTRDSLLYRRSSSSQLGGPSANQLEFSDFKTSMITDWDPLRLLFYWDLGFILGDWGLTPSSLDEHDGTRCVKVFEREREEKNVGVCVIERECVCVREREREKENLCVSTLTP